MALLLKTAQLFNYAHCSQMFYFSFIIISIIIIIVVTIWSCLRIRGYHPNSQITISRGRMISYDKLQYQWIFSATLFSIKTIFLNSSDLVNTQRFGSEGRIISISSCHEALTGARDPSARDCQQTWVHRAHFIDDDGCS